MDGTSCDKIDHHTTYIDQSTCLGEGEGGESVKHDFAHVVAEGYW